MKYPLRFIALGSVAVVLVKVVLNGGSAFGVSFGTIDAGVIAAILTPTVGAFVASLHRGMDPEEHEAPEVKT